MQANLETLRTRVGQVADLRDAQGIREGQRVLSTRLAEVEECISVQNVREFMRRIMRLEAQIGGNHGGVMGETVRSCLARLDGQAVELEDFRARLRTQEWYHDLSEQGSDEGIQHMGARTEGQCMDRVAQVDNRLEQFRRGIRQDALDIALTLQKVMQDVQCQGQGIEQIRHTLFDIAMEKLETLDSRFQEYDEFVQQVLAKADKQG